LGFWGLECPNCTNDLCPAIVETRLGITVSCPLIVSTVIFSNGLAAAGREFASWNAVINAEIFSEGFCNLERASDYNIKSSTEKDGFSIEQCLLRINPSNDHHQGYNMSTSFVLRYKLSEFGAYL